MKSPNIEARMNAMAVILLDSLLASTRKADKVSFTADDLAWFRRPVSK